MNTALPTGACNAHCHVFGPRDQFPYAADAPFVPEHDAPREALYALNDRLGLQRCVIVQSACHGLDNSVTAHAIAGRPRDYRGVALVRTDVADAELARLDAAGFRGVRFNYMGHLGTRTPVDEVLALARRLAPLGWHLQIHGDTKLLTEVAPALRDAPVPVVIDHIGRVDAALGLQQPAFAALLALAGLADLLGQGQRRGPHHAAGPALRRRRALRGAAGGRLRRPRRLGQRLAAPQPRRAGAHRGRTRRTDPSHGPDR